MNYFWLLSAKTGSYGRMVGSRLCPCGVVLKLEVEALGFSFRFNFGLDIKIITSISSILCCSAFVPMLDVNMTLVCRYSENFVFCKSTFLHFSPNQLLL